MSLSFDDWIPDVRQIEAGPVEAQPASRLRAAFDQVPRDTGGGQAVPIIPAPAVFVNGRPNGQAGIRDASGDHDPRSASERFDDAARAEIRVGRDNWLVECAEGLARVEVCERDFAAQFLDSREQVIAADDPNFYITEIRFAQDLGRFVSASPRIHSAGVRDDAQFWPFGQERRDVREHREKIACVTERRILDTLLGQDRHRQFGQVLERQVLDLRPLEQRPRRGERITPKSGSVGDREHAWFLGDGR